MAWVLNPILDLLFPHHCDACGRHAEQWLCDECLSQLHEQCSEPRCDICGYPLHNAGEPCPQCLHRPGRLIRRTLRLTLHEGVARHLVHRLKFSRRWPLASSLAGLTYGQAYARQLLAETDIIVPVPLHWWRYWRRGFNQSALLADELAKLSHHRVVHALRRTRHTHAQSTLRSPTARLRNVKDAFAARAGKDIAGKRVLLIDDVTTTGATLRAAARALHHLNPAHVNALVLTMADPR